MARETFSQTKELVVVRAGAASQSAAASASIAVTRLSVGSVAARPVPVSRPDLRQPATRRRGIDQLVG